MPKKYVSPERKFDDFAGEYDPTVTDPDYAYVGADRVFNEVSGFLEACPNARVLDVGCGSGLLGERFKKDFPDIELIGIDVSAKMRVAARKKKIYASLKKVNLERDRIPSRTDYFDLIVSSAVFDYVRRLDNSFSEFGRTLKPTGMSCFKPLLAKMRRVLKLGEERTLYSMIWMLRC